MATSCVLRDHNHRISNVNNKGFVKERVDDFIGYVKGKFSDTNNENFDAKELDLLGGKQADEPVFTVEQKPYLGFARASSLVQIWEERLGRSSSNNASSTVPSRVNSGVSSSDNASVVEEAPRVSFSGESDSMSDSSFRSRNSDAVEGERVSVAQIVRKLSNADGDGENFGVVDQGELKGVAGNGFCFPKIRGRMALNDLLMRMERDRHRELDALVERRAVSKFKHRKRIQSMLRLRILRVPLAAEGDECSKKSKTPDIKRPAQGSNIMQLREKFSMGFGRCMTFPSHDGSSRRPKSEVKCSTQHNKELSYFSQLKEDNHQQDLSSFSQLKEDNDQQQETRGSPDFSYEGPNYVSGNFSSQLNENSHHQEVHTFAQYSISQGSHIAYVHEANPSLDITEGTGLQTSYSDSPDSEGIPHFPWQTGSWDFGHFNSDGSADETMFSDNWDGNDEVFEDEEEEEELMEPNYDWINDIARPRSYWEDCRRSRYQEVLSTKSKNDIRQLLERGTVSTFLTSSLRDKIDQLMESRLRGTQIIGTRDVDSSHEGSEQLMLSSDRYTHSVTSIEEGTEKKEGEVEGVEEAGKVTNSAIRRHHDQSEEERQELDNHSDQDHGTLEEVHQTSILSPDEAIETYYFDQYHETSDCIDYSTSLQMLSQSQRDSWNCQYHQADGDFVRTLPVQSESYCQETEHSNPRESSVVSFYFNMEGVEKKLGEAEVVEEAGGVTNSVTQHHYNDCREELPEVENPNNQQEHKTFEEVCEKGSWDFQNPEAGYDFDKATSTFSIPPLQSESYCQETQRSNSICRSSIDVEIINDMRGKMEQLQQEILELRKSVQFCMDMQFNMQKIFKQDVHSVTSDGRNLQHKRVRKDQCCICYGDQVDSLLYRCGHMCTCLKCAQVLKLSGGKCPICQASIDDVVQTHTYSEFC